MTVLSSLTWPRSVCSERFLRSSHTAAGNAKSPMATSAATAEVRSGVGCATVRIEGAFAAGAMACYLLFQQPHGDNTLGAVECEAQPAAHSRHRRGRLTVSG